jgi:thiopeptide-type bacteriocin biosynthesis protein
MAAWGERERWLLGRLAEVCNTGGEELELDDDDVKALAAATPAELPAAWSVLARVAAGGDVLVEGAGGPSGARLLGRFCHLDPAIETMVRDHVEREAAAHPGLVLAEVVHLADGRTGNILCRPVLREHEIVYLGRSGAPDGSQLLLDDLTVSLRGDRIVLRSRRLDCEVVPRLTSAHNVAAHGLGVYRFLAALQQQDGSGVGWSWGALADAPRLPRVRIGRVVVSRASWQLERDELRALTVSRGRTEQFAAVQALRSRRGLPRYVVVSDADNELWIDLDHALQVDAMVATIGGRDRATLTEVWPPATHSFASEVVVAFCGKTSAVTQASRVRRDDATPTTRRFAPGSRWLYAKLYGGVSSADRALRDVVGPVARAALASGAARRWFFVRYADPHPHLRVRFDGDPARLLAETLPSLHDAAASLLADGALWRIQLDTYEREVERYGGPAGIETSEDIFWHDSEAALSVVDQLDGDAGNEARWQLALVSAERLLAALALDAPARERIFAAGKQSLATEHRAGVPLLKAIGERWRSHEERLGALLDRGAALAADDACAVGIAAYARRDERLRQLRHGGAGWVREPMTDGVAWSLVHMSCNRLLHASARAQELVIYEMLRRWHGRRRARVRRASEVAA